jgi:hypothetical protein
MLTKIVQIAQYLLRYTGSTVSTLTAPNSPRTQKEEFYNVAVSICITKFWLLLEVHTKKIYCILGDIRREKQWKEKREQGNTKISRKMKYYQEKKEGRVKELEINRTIGTVKSKCFLILYKLCL